MESTAACAFIAAHQRLPLSQLGKAIEKEAQAVKGLYCGCQPLLTSSCEDASNHLHTSDEPFANGNANMRHLKISVGAQATLRKDLQDSKMRSVSPEKRLPKTGQNASNTTLKVECDASSNSHEISEETGAQATDCSLPDS